MSKLQGINRLTKDIQVRCATEEQARQIHIIDWSKVYEGVKIAKSQDYHLMECPIKRSRSGRRQNHQFTRSFQQPSMRSHHQNHPRTLQQTINHSVVIYE
jgi:hypothetical protein